MKEPVSLRELALSAAFEPQLVGRTCVFLINISLRILSEHYDILCLRFKGEKGFIDKDTALFFTK